MSGNSGKLFALLGFYVSWDCIRSGNTINTKKQIKFEIPKLEYLIEVDASIFLKKKKKKEN